MAMRTEAASKGKIGRERTEASDYFRFLLRMPQDMAERVAALARADFCPTNAYLLRLIRDALPLHERAAQEAGLLPAKGVEPTEEVPSVRSTRRPVRMS